MVLDAARGPDDARPNPAAWAGWLKTKLGSPRKLGKIDRITGERVKRGNHASMPYKDLPAFYARLAETPGVAAKALMLAILTRARTSEVLNATFEEISFAAAVWRVPAERMKMDEPHDVPLSNRRCAIIADQMAGRGKGQFVFRGGRPRQPLSTMAMAMVMRKLGVSANSPCTDFRSTARSWMADNGVAFDLAEMCLAHAVGRGVIFGGNGGGKTRRSGSGVGVVTAAGGLGWSCWTSH